MTDKFMLETEVFKKNIDELIETEVEFSLLNVDRQQYILNTILSSVEHRLLEDDFKLLQEHLDMFVFCAKKRAESFLDELYESAQYNPNVEIIWLARFFQDKSLNVKEKEMKILTDKISDILLTKKKLIIKTDDVVFNAYFWEKLGVFFSKLLHSEQSRIILRNYTDQSYEQKVMDLLHGLKVIDCTNTDCVEVTYTIPNEKKDN